jgi:D-alanine-D-alanine ligase
VITNKLRIGVLMGGRSIEREVSFNSGRTICDHLDTQRYIIIPLFQTETGSLYILPPHFLHRGKISDFFGRLDKEAQKVSWDQLKKTVDFVYLAVHGRYGEDGTIQGMLEVLKIPYLGSKVLGSALGMDKVIQKSIMAANGIDVARGINLSPQDLESITLEDVLQKLNAAQVSFPVIIKPSHEGSSLGITVVTKAEDLLAALNAACFVDARRKQDILIEEKLEGMEFVCVSLQKIRNHDGKIHSEWFSLPLTEVVIEDNSQLFDYEQKYMPGRALKITPARCSQEDQQKIVTACEKAAQILFFSTISRIDGFLTKDGRVVLIDPNSLTGMSPSTFLFHQAAEIGMSHTDLINFLIENELHAYGLYNVAPDSSLTEDANMNASTQQKIRVAVLLGGDSNEREISLESGRNICYKLSPQKYDVTPLFVNDDMELFRLDQKLLIKNSTRSIAQLVTPDIQVQWSDLPSICDFVFIGLHGGKGEGGAVQGALEMLDLPYNGPGVLASAMCMDKFKTNNFLRAKGFHVPSSTLIQKIDWLQLDEANKESFVQNALKAALLQVPLIVKPHDDGCSVMVNKATTIPDLIAILENYFTSDKPTALIEELIIGYELTGGVIGNENPVALPPSMAVAKGGILSIEEKFLPGAGENQTPAPLPTEVLDLVKATLIEAYKTIGCQGYSRIDCFYQPAGYSPTGKDRVVLLEFNTLPGLTPATCLFHQAAEVGMKPMDLINTIIELGLERNRQQHLDSPQLADVDNEGNQDKPKRKPKVKQQDTTLQADTEEKDLNMTLF